jgi:hypothetical protein
MAATRLPGYDDAPIGCGDGNMPDADRVKNACEACFGAHSDDCSGFARAVADRLSVVLQGQADEIVDALRTSGDWKVLPDGLAAAESAAGGKLVIAGLKGSEQVHPDAHGHVVVVVDGPLERDRYPTAYWGKLHGAGQKNSTINFAWAPVDRDKVTYAERAI